MLNRKQRRIKAAKKPVGKIMPRKEGSSVGAKVTHAYITNEHFLCEQLNPQSPDATQQKAQEGGVVSCNTCQRILYKSGLGTLATQWQPERLQ